MSTEPIETSVISIDTEMIIVQPAEMNQAANPSQNRNEQEVSDDVNIVTVESANEVEVTPNRKKRKR